MIKKIISILFAITSIVIITYLLFIIVDGAIYLAKSVESNVLAASITAFLAVIASTITVVLGKYYERKKDIETHYRAKKTEIYDDFLREFFKSFSSEEENQEENNELTEFLREWQRKMIIWGGQDVLIKYATWMNHLKKGNADAKSLLLMDGFFLEMRNDLGHKSDKLDKYFFTHFVLKNPELFLEMIKINPDLTLAELAEAEEKINNHS